MTEPTAPATRPAEDAAASARAAGTPPAPATPEGPAASERRYGLRDLLEPPDLRRLWQLMVLILVAGLFETVTVASLLPFLGAIVDAESVKASGHLSWAYDALGFSSRRDFVIALGFASLTLLLVGNTLQALVRWRTSCFTADVNERLSRRLLSTYLHAPYEFHLSRNATDLARSVLDEVQHVTNEYLFPLLLLVHRATASALLIGMLLLLDPLIALLAGASLGGVYLLALRIFRRAMRQAGAERGKANEGRHRHAHHGLAAIRELKLYEAEEQQMERFSQSAKSHARAHVTQDLISQLPRLAIEVVAFGSIILVSLLALQREGSAGAAVATLGLFAFAGYRLVPAFQVCYFALSQMRYRGSAMGSLREDLAHVHREPACPPCVRVEPRHSFGLVNATFRYPGRHSPVIADFSAHIPLGTSLAITGPTGAGKSTVLDLLFGLLRPGSGALVVDGRPVPSDAIRAWRRSLAYVSQSPVLIDGTVRQNIAFGLPSGRIDERRLRASVARAMIEDFILRELPHGFDTPVGDRGVNLSGGQRQRIAIARALYAGRSILGLDEASSGLDEKTEREVMEALLRGTPALTVVLVTHRRWVADLATNYIELPLRMLSEPSIRLDCSSRAPRIDRSAR